MPRQLATSVSPLARSGPRSGGSRLNSDTGSQETPSLRKQDIVVDELLDPRNAHKLCLLADSGAGKTRLLTRWAAYAAERFLRQADKARLPFLLEAADWRPTEDLDFLELLCRQSSRLTRPLVQKLCEAGRAVVFLDGLDRLPQRRSERFQEWLDHNLAHEAIGNCAVVLAGRPEAFDWSRLGQFAPAFLEFSPFSKDEITAYINDFFETHPSVGRQIIARLDEHAVAYTLLGRPLRLRILCDLCKRTAVRVPAAEADLLEMAARDVLEGMTWPCDASMAVLGELAWRMWRGGASSMSRSTAIRHLARQYGRNSSVSTGIRQSDIQHLCAALAARASILYMQEAEIGFREDAYLEFFAGRHLASRQKERIRQLFDEHVLDQRWSNVLAAMMARLWKDRRCLARDLLCSLVNKVKRGRGPAWHTHALTAGHFACLSILPDEATERVISDLAPLVRKGRQFFERKGLSDRLAWADYLMHSLDELVTRCSS